MHACMGSRQAKHVGEGKTSGELHVFHLRSARPGVARSSDCPPSSTRRGEVAPRISIVMWNATVGPPDVDMTVLPMEGSDTRFSSLLPDGDSTTHDLRVCKHSEIVRPNHGFVFWRLVKNSRGARVQLERPTRFEGR